MTDWDRNDWTIMLGTVAMWFNGLGVGLIASTVLS